MLSTNCGVGDRLHHRTEPSISNIDLHDISGRNAERPRLVHEFKVDTHEFFLWQDPNDADRALMFAGSASGTCAIRGGAPSCPFAVWDISPVVDGQSPVKLHSGLHPYTSVTGKPRGGLHSLSVSNDGSRADFALRTGGFAVVDTSGFAAGRPARSPDRRGRVPRARERPVHVRRVEPAADLLLGAQPDADADHRLELSHSGGLHTVSWSARRRRTSWPSSTRPARERGPRGPAALVRPGHGAQREGRDVELPDHPGRPDLRRRPAQRPLRPQLPRGVQPRGAQGEVLEGNSNQGTALCCEPVGSAARHCR